MEYTQAELRQAFLADEVARLTAQHSRMFSVSQLKPDYTGLGDDRPAAATLTAEDVDQAKYELTGLHPGLDPDDVESAVLSLTAGERDPGSQAMALVQLAGMEGHQIMRLTAPCACCGGAPVMGPVGLSVSTEERKKLARSGAALGDGSWPIHDLKHLAAAKSFYHQGKLAGHSAAEVRRHINSRARALGGAGLDDEEDEDETQPRARRKVAATRAVRGQLPPPGGSSGGNFGVAGWGVGGGGAQDFSGGGPSGGGGTSMTASQVLNLTGAVGRYADEYPEFFLGLAAYPDAGDHSPGYESAFAQGVPASFKPSFRIYDVGVQGDGEDISPDQLAEIERISQVNETLVAGKNIGGSKTGSITKYPARSLAARNAAETRALAGGRPQNRITV